MADPRRRRTRRRPTRSSSSTRIPRTPAPTSPSASPATSPSRRSSARGAAGRRRPRRRRGRSARPSGCSRASAPASTGCGCARIDAAEIPNVDPTPAGQDRGFGPNDTDPFVWTRPASPRHDHRLRPGRPDRLRTPRSSSSTPTRPARPSSARSTGRRTSAARPATRPARSCPARTASPRSTSSRSARSTSTATPTASRSWTCRPRPTPGRCRTSRAPETFFLGADEIGPEQFLEPGLRFTFRGDDDLGSSFELEFECAVHQHDRRATPWSGRSAASPRPTTPSSTRSRSTTSTAGAYTFQVRALDIAGNHDADARPGAGVRVRRRGASPRRRSLSVTPDIAGARLRDDRDRPSPSSSPAPAPPSCARSTRRPSRRARRRQAATPTSRTASTCSRSSRSASSARPTRTPAEFEFVSGTDVAPDVTITTAPPATGGTATSGHDRVRLDRSGRPPSSASLDSGPELPCSSPFDVHGPPGRRAEPAHLRGDGDAGRTCCRASTLVTAIARVGRSPTTPLPRRSCSRRCRPTRAATRSSSGSPAPTTARSRRTSTFECRARRRRPVGSACSSPHTLADLTGGAHTFEVRAIDETLAHRRRAGELHLGRHRAAADRHHQRGAGRHRRPEGDVSTSATGELSFFDQPGSTYECRLDAVDPDVDPFDACTSPYPYDLSNGEHVFEVRATTLPLNGQTHDREPGRASTRGRSTPPTRPTRTRRSSSARRTRRTNTSATFLFSGTDNLTAPADLTFECSLDGAPFADCQSGDVYDRPGRRRRTPSRCVRSDTAVPPNVDELAGDLRLDDRGSRRGQHAGGHERRGVRGRREHHLRRASRRRRHVGLRR